MHPMSSEIPNRSVYYSSSRSLKRLTTSTILENINIAGVRTSEHDSPWWNPNVTNDVWMGMLFRPQILGESIVALSHNQALWLQLMKYLSTFSSHEGRERILRAPVCHWYRTQTITDTLPIWVTTTSAYFMYHGVCVSAIVGMFNSVTNLKQTSRNSFWAAKVEVNDFHCDSDSIFRCIAIAWTRLIDKGLLWRIIVLKRFKINNFSNRAKGFCSFYRPYTCQYNCSLWEQRGGNPTPTLAC